MAMIGPFTQVAYFFRYYLKWSKHELVVLSFDYEKRLTLGQVFDLNLRNEMTYESGLEMV